MITYLKSRQHYEDLYDEGTVAQCRSGEELVNETFRKMEQTVPASEFQERPVAWYLEYAKYYFQFVEVVAAGRYHQREKTIAAWMEADGQKDARLENAMLNKTPFCLSCGQDMGIWNKCFLHRQSGDSEEDVLLMFECGACHKRRVFWQDGTEWEGARVYCPKCKAEMSVAHKEDSKAITSTYTCASCGHSYQEVYDLTRRPVQGEKTVDPRDLLDRKRFCLDSETMQLLDERLGHLARLGKLYADATERTENTDIYDAVKDIKLLKIVQLMEALRPAIEKKQYSEFKLGEPQLGNEVIIEFSCLDAKPDREEYRSKADLRKLISKILEETNWRLMTDSIRYRLGYLTGRLRAYEGEEALKKLVEQRIKEGTLKPKPQKPAPLAEPDVDKLDKVQAIKLYAEGERLTMNSTPIENGTKRPGRHLFIRGQLHPNLRIVIPLRDNDDSVPGFVREFDFKFDTE